MSEQVLNQVNRNRIVELACNLANIVSITGEEESVARYLGSEFEKLGMQVEYQYVEDGRPNVVGTLKGTGGGATLMFNAHMDHFDNPQETVVDDDRIYGRGLVNMKAAFPCYIEAVSALQKAGVKLRGDLIIAGVVGEIEKAQVGRFQGKTYRGAGVGARYLMDHGVMADMCIIGEPTGLQLQIGNSGLFWARVSVDGKATKFVLAACKVAQAIQDWEKEYQRKISASSLCCRRCRSAPLTAATRLSPELVRRPISLSSSRCCRDAAAWRSSAKSSRFAKTFANESRISSIFGWISISRRPATRSPKTSRSSRRWKRRTKKFSTRMCLTRSRSVTASPATARASQQYGVPAITYGPGFGTHLVDPTETKAGEEWDSPTGVRRGVGITNMVNCTKVYAMAALDICNKNKEDSGEDLCEIPTDLIEMRVSMLIY